MGAMSRSKGASAEREFARLFHAETGIQLRRRLVQYQGPGHCDLEAVDLPDWPWRIECKRYSAASEAMIGQWWLQAARQAVGDEGIPVLAYRADRRPWRVRLPIKALWRDAPLLDGVDATAELSLLAFAAVARERL